MHKFVPELVALAVLLNFSWKYVFSKGSLASVSLKLKLIHAGAFIFISLICFESVRLAMWILEHPTQWKQSLSQARQFYPLWVDVVAQLSESVIGPISLICCYFVLKGSEKARRLFLLLLPIIYLLFCYHGLQAGVRHYGGFSPRIFVLMGITGIPFAGVFIFYSRPFAIIALFRSSG